MIPSFFSLQVCISFCCHDDYRAVGESYRVYFVRFEKSLFSEWRLLKTIIELDRHFNLLSGRVVLWALLAREKREKSQQGKCSIKLPFILIWTMLN